MIARMPRGRGTTAGSLRRGQLTAVLAGALVPLVLLTGMLLPTSFEETEAGWTDTTDVQATATAATIPAPTLTRQCEFRPGLLGIAARVRIHWRMPEGYSLEVSTLEASTSGLGSALKPLTGFNLAANTTHQGGGVYQTDIPAYLLGGLLGLMTELEVAISIEDESGWTSESAAIASNAGLLIGLGGNCRNLT